jgi:TM2 domain-containing membrane protein YozV
MSRESMTHNKAVGYVFWLLGFSGLHRFYCGRNLTGIVWFFTFGLFLIGWLVDLFLVPSLIEQAGRRYTPGRLDYSVAWLLLVFLGVFGAHRFYQGKVGTAILYLLTAGLLGIGVIYDILTLNSQLTALNQRRG